MLATHQISLLSLPLEKSPDKNQFTLGTRTPELAKTLVEHRARKRDFPNGHQRTKMSILSLPGVFRKKTNITLRNSEYMAIFRQAATFSAEFSQINEIYVRASVLASLIRQSCSEQRRSHQIHRLVSFRTSAHPFCPTTGTALPRTQETANEYSRTGGKCSPASETCPEW